MEEDAWVYEDSRVVGAKVLTEEDAKNWEDCRVVDANGLTCEIYITLRRAGLRKCWSNLTMAKGKQF